MEKVLGNLDRGLLFVLSAPAGTGKTTLIQMLTKEFPTVVQSVSYTTRKPRAGEVSGVHYNFITGDEFTKMAEEGEFLEHVTVYGHSYGTSRKWVEEQIEKGRHVVLVIETQGATALRQSCDATYIFLMPPSEDELKRRLQERKTETVESIERRIKWANIEIEGGKDYDYQIMNKDLNVAYDALRSIIIAEEHKKKYLNY